MTLMNRGNFVAFLPCRSGSVRVKDKNTKPFAGDEGGLVARKLRHLIESEVFSEIVVSTDDSKVIAIAERFVDSAKIPIRIIERPAELAISDSLDKFVAYVPSVIETGVVCWVHATSPFFGAESFKRAILEYNTYVLNGRFDSLMGVSKLHNFFWRDGSCISHDRNLVKWPQTQDISPFFEVNSTIFMIDVSLMASLIDRVGSNPRLFETTKFEAIDVDWPEDFLYAEKIAALDC